MTREASQLEIVDAHHHLWELSRFPYRWLAPDAPPRRFGDHSAIKQNYLPADYRADFSGLNLVGSVHVQANCGATDPVAETEWLQGLSDKSGVPTAAVAEADLTTSDAPALIARHAAFPVTRGVRAMVAWDTAGRWRFAERPHVLAEPGFRSNVQALSEHDLSLDLVVVPTQLGEVGDLARELPSLGIAINHLGQVEPDQPGNAQGWQKGLAALADLENVHLKISGLWTIDRAWRRDLLAPMVNYALDTLGADRLMFGSNLPVEKVNRDVAAQVATLLQILEHRPAADIRKIFADTARAFYRL